MTKDIAKIRSDTKKKMTQGIPRIELTMTNANVKTVGGQFSIGPKGKSYKKFPTNSQTCSKISLPFRTRHWSRISIISHS